MARQRPDGAARAAAGHATLPGDLDAALAAVAGPSDARNVRFLPPCQPAIVPATDLGNVMVLKHGNLYLLTDQFGDIHPDSRGLGLYAGDTRVLSCSALHVNGQRPSVLLAASGQNYRDHIQLTNPDVLRDPGAKVRPEISLARQSLGISRERLLDQGLQERLRIDNFTEHPETVLVELDLAADDADIFEVRGYPRPVRGVCEPIAVADGRVTFGYLGRDGVRRRTYVAFSAAATTVTGGGPCETPEEGAAADGARVPEDARGSDGERGPGGGDGTRRMAAATDSGTDAGDPEEDGRLHLTWKWELAPGARVELTWRVWADQARVAEPLAAAQVFDPAAFDAVRTNPARERARAAASSGGASVAVPSGPDPRREDPATLFPPPPHMDADDGAAAYRAWFGGTARVRTDNELLDLTLERSLTDLRLLVNDGPGPDERYVAAGVPWFATLFGRDSLVSAYQLLAFRPQLAIETLAVLGDRQAKAEEPSRDAEPGKILHELRRGEMAGAGEIPHDPYYGSIDSTPLWLILLGATFDWTGDRDLLDRHWPTALRALEWIDRYGDRDGDGFVEYERRTDRGLLNQGWKDSSDAIRGRDGRRVPAPVALVEVQGYVYDAKTRLAQLARVRGEHDLAARLEREAATLRDRFEAAFWLESERYYAMALGGDKQPADAIGSNAGQCLWTGIVDPGRAKDVAARLLGPELFSGWGIRTYASGQPGYNPIGYHTGSVWPHDTSLIAAGLKRYGFHEEANLLAARILQAAHAFPQSRLPELFCGFDRDGTSSPVPYPVACSPQAWSAGAPFLFLQTMLGLRARADRAELELVRPHLPDWLEWVTVSDLRVGDAAVDLLVRRSGTMTSAEVTRRVGDLSVTVRL